MQEKIYDLPDISVIGGTTQNIRLRLYTYEGLIIDTAGVQAAFSLVNSLHRGSSAVLCKGMAIISNTDKPEVAVTLTPEETKDLYGRFIYQVTLIDSKGVSEVLQGCMAISRNVDKSPLSSMPSPATTVAGEFAEGKTIKGTYYPVVETVADGYTISWSQSQPVEAPKPLKIKHGKTPKKGVDYFTEGDKTELVNSVLSKLPTWNGGVF